MRDVFPILQRWLADGRRVVMARVIATWGSSPRETGSVMLIRDDLLVAGSVSGGCIEGAVIQEAESVFADGQPRVLEFGVSDERAWSVGLSCGGRVRVLVEPHFLFTGRSEDRSIWQQLEQAMITNEPALLLTWLPPQNHRHLLITPEAITDGTVDSPLPSPLRNAVLRSWQERTSQQIDIDGEEIFCHYFSRQPVLLLIGAAHISIPLINFAQELGFRTVVIDPRRIFTSTERFDRQPDVLDDRWPQEALKEVPLHEDTYAVTLTHDPKIDDPALHILLKSPVAYIGALGSQRTHEKRVNRLLEAGFTREDISRIHAPVGLDIDARNPSEIALSIMAQIVAVRNARRRTPE
ncbi:MAG: XdhC family protein [Calditrichaeota bacterium]|nr:XdhC family protein [Calditrichota bacterium]